MTSLATVMMKAVLPGHAVDFAAQADDDVPQGPVVHIQAALDQDPPGVDAQGVALLEVVVQHGAAAGCWPR